TVDFHTLENINHVNKGDVVAVLHKEDRGDDGIDVLGRRVPPRKVKHVIFRYGRNLSQSEDGTELMSQVSGHVILENDKIFVSNVLELVNVDNSTGDIDYEGDVVVKGNVLADLLLKQQEILL
ncbi:MAG: flagellar assembly protein A, partial [Lachnospira pectinoschiza]